MIYIVCWGKYFTLIDVVNLNCLKNLCFCEMTDTAFCHNRNRNRFLNSTNHLRVAHSGNTTGCTNVGWDSL